MKVTVDSHGFVQSFAYEGTPSIAPDMTLPEYRASRPRCERRVRILRRRIHDLATPGGAKPSTTT